MNKLITIIKAPFLLIATCVCIFCVVISVIWANITERIKK